VREPTTTAVAGAAALRWWREAVVDTGVAGVTISLTNDATAGVGSAAAAAASFFDFFLREVVDVDDDASRSISVGLLSVAAVVASFFNFPPPPALSFFFFLDVTGEGGDALMVGVAELSSCSDLTIIIIGTWSICI